MQPAFATELLHRLKALGIHTAVETAGFVPERAFRDALPAIDLLLFDIKHPQESPHRQATGVSLQPILSNLACALSQGKAVCVRIPVIPGFNDSDACQTAFADLLASMEVQSVQLLPFHQLGEAKHAMLGRAYSFGGVPSLDHGALGPFSALLRGRGFRCIGA